MFSISDDDDLEFLGNDFLDIHSPKKRNNKRSSFEIGLSDIKSSIKKTCFDRSSATHMTKKDAEIADSEDARDGKGRSNDFTFHPAPFSKAAKENVAHETLDVLSGLAGNHKSDATLRIVDATTSEGEARSDSHVKANDVDVDWGLDSDLDLSLLSALEDSAESQISRVQDNHNATAKKLLPWNKNSAPKITSHTQKDMVPGSKEKIDHRSYDLGSLRLPNNLSARNLGSVSDRSTAATPVIPITIKQVSGTSLRTIPIKSCVQESIPNRIVASELHGANPIYPITPKAVTSQSVKEHCVLPTDISRGALQAPNTRAPVASSKVQTPTHQNPLFKRSNKSPEFTPTKKLPFQKVSPEFLEESPAVKNNRDAPTRYITPKYSSGCSGKGGRNETPRNRKSRRKFPGPAGMLPKLAAGQDLDSAPVRVEENVSKVMEDRNKSPLKDNSGVTPSQMTQVPFGDEVWHCLKEDIGPDIYNICQDFSIANIILKSASKQLPRGKVPVMCAMVDHMVVLAAEASVVLKDTSGEIKATVHRQVVKDFQEDFQAGCGVVLKQVGVFSPSTRKHYLNITPNNVVYIYTKKDVQLSCRSVSNLTLAEIEESLVEVAEPEHVPPGSGVPQTPRGSAGSHSTRTPVPSTSGLSCVKNSHYGATPRSHPPAKGTPSSVACPSRTGTPRLPGSSNHQHSLPPERGTVDTMNSYRNNSTPNSHYQCGRPPQCGGTSSTSGETMPISMPGYTGSQTNVQLRKPTTAVAMAARTNSPSVLSNKSALKSASLNPRTSCRIAIDTNAGKSLSGINNDKPMATVVTRNAQEQFIHQGSKSTNVCVNKQLPNISTAGQFSTKITGSPSQSSNTAKDVIQPMKQIGTNNMASSRHGIPAKTSEEPITSWENESISDLLCGLEDEMMDELEC